MKDPYKASDKAISVLKKRTIKRFAKAKEQASQLHFDELNVLKGAKDLYKNLNEDNEEVFLQMSRIQYEKALKDCEAILREDEKPNVKSRINKLWLLALLAEVDPVTKYSYRNEVTRKRDYLSEAVQGSQTAKSAQYTKSMMLWSGMTEQYADTVSDKAMLMAYEDSGVKKVKWVSQKDDRVCNDCKELDEKVFDIDNVPPKPHWRCRCYVTPLIGAKV